MAMCNMPLLIKVRMTKENYENLLTEVKTYYLFKYINKHYLWENGYFKLDTNYMDDFDIYKEAERIAKYIEPTEEQVGLIYAGRWSYQMGDLYFKDGKIDIRNVFEYETEKYSDVFKKDYLKRRRKFFNSFRKRTSR